MECIVPCAPLPFTSNMRSLTEADVLSSNRGDLGEAEAGRVIVATIEGLLQGGGPRTRDMGGQAGTAEVGSALAEAIAAR